MAAPLLDPINIQGKVITADALLTSAASPITLAVPAT